MDNLIVVPRKEKGQYLLYIYINYCVREKTSIGYLIENRPHTNNKMIKRLVNANKEQEHYKWIDSESMYSFFDVCELHLILL